MHGEMLDSLPTKLRGRVPVPSISELKMKVAARAKALGLFTPPSSSSVPVPMQAPPPAGAFPAIMDRPTTDEAGQDLGVVTATVEGTALASAPQDLSCFFFA